MLINNSLKRKYNKYIKVSGKANSLEQEFIKEFKKKVSYDKILSLRDAVEEKGTDDDKRRYSQCCQNYNEGRITIEDYEIYEFCQDLYGRHIREIQIKEGILEG